MREAKAATNLFYKRFFFLILCYLSCVWGQGAIPVTASTTISCVDSPANAVVSWDGTSDENLESSLRLFVLPIPDFEPLGSSSSSRPGGREVLEGLSLSELMQSTPTTESSIPCTDPLSHVIDVSGGAGSTDVYLGPGLWYVVREDAYGDGGLGVSLTVRGEEVLTLAGESFEFVHYAPVVVDVDSDLLLNVTFETRCDRDPLELSWNLYVFEISGEFFSDPIMCRYENEVITTTLVLYDWLWEVRLYDAAADGLTPEIPTEESPYFVVVSYERVEGTPRTMTHELSWEAEGGETLSSEQFTTVRYNYDGVVRVLVTYDCNSCTDECEISLQKSGSDPVDFYNINCDVSSNGADVLSLVEGDYLLSIDDESSKGRPDVSIKQVYGSETNDHVSSTEQRFTRSYRQELTFDEASVIDESDEDDSETEHDNSNEEEDSDDEDDTKEAHAYYLYGDYFDYDVCSNELTSGDTVVDTSEATGNFFVRVSVDNFYLEARYWFMDFSGVSYLPISSDTESQPFETATSSMPFFSYTGESTGLFPSSDGVETSFPEGEPPQTGHPDTNSMFEFGEAGETDEYYVDLEPGYYTILRFDEFGDGGISIVFESDSNKKLFQLNPYYYSDMRADFLVVSDPDVGSDVDSDVAAVRVKFSDTNAVLWTVYDVISETYLTEGSFVSCSSATTTEGSENPTGAPTFLEEFGRSQVNSRDFTAGRHLLYTSDGRRRVGEENTNGDIHISSAMYHCGGVLPVSAGHVYLVVASSNWDGDLEPEGNVEIMGYVKGSSDNDEETRKYDIRVTRDDDDSLLTPFSSLSFPFIDGDVEMEVVATFGTDLPDNLYLILVSCYGEGEWEFGVHSTGISLESGTCSSHEMVSRTTSLYTSDSYYVSRSGDVDMGFTVVNVATSEVVFSVDNMQVSEMYTGFIEVESTTNILVALEFFEDLSCSVELFHFNGTSLGVYEDPFNYFTLPAGAYVVETMGCASLDVSNTATGTIHTSLKFEDYFDKCTYLFSVDFNETRKLDTSMLTAPHAVMESIASGAVEAMADTIQLGSSPTYRRLYGDYGQLVALQFNSVRIPKGATVRSAALRFVASESPLSSRPPVMTIRGELGFSRALSPHVYNVSNRTRTNARVDWSPGEWVADSLYISDDVAAVVQEIVDDPHWSYSSSITFIINGTGVAAAYAPISDGSCIDLAPSFTFSFDIASVDDYEYTNADPGSCDVNFSCVCGECSDGQCTCAQIEDGVVAGAACEIPVLARTGSESDENLYQILSFLVNDASDDVDDVGEGCNYLTEFDQSGGPGCTLRGALVRASSLLARDRSGSVIMVIVRADVTPYIILKDQIYVNGNNLDAGQLDGGNAIQIIGSPGWLEGLDSSSSRSSEHTFYPAGMPVIVAAPSKRHLYLEDVWMYLVNITFIGGYSESSLVPDDDGFVNVVSGGSSIYQGSNSATKIMHCVFTSSYSEENAAVDVSYTAYSVISHTWFYRNHSPWGASAVNCEGTCIITNSVFEENSGSAALSHSGSGALLVMSTMFNGNDGGGDGYGGGASVKANAEFHSCVFSNNYAVFGGGVYSSGYDVVIASSVFTGNKAQLGGALFVNTTTAVLVSFSNDYDGNTAMSGGAIHIVSGSTTLIEDTFSNNTARADNAFEIIVDKRTAGCGGAISTDIDDKTIYLVVTGGTFTGNSDLIEVESVWDSRDDIHAAICTTIEYGLFDSYIDEKDMSIPEQSLYVGCGVEEVCKEDDEDSNYCLDLAAERFSSESVGVRCTCERKATCTLAELMFAEMSLLSASENNLAVRVVKVNDTLVNGHMVNMFVYVVGCGEVKWEITNPDLGWMEVSQSETTFLDKHYCEAQCEQRLQLDIPVDIVFNLEGLSAGLYNGDIPVSYTAENPTMNTLTSESYTVSVGLTVETPVSSVHSNLSGPYWITYPTAIDEARRNYDTIESTFLGDTGGIIAGENILFEILARDFEGLPVGFDNVDLEFTVIGDVTVDVELVDSGAGTLLAMFTAPYTAFFVIVSSSYLSMENIRIDHELWSESYGVVCPSTHQWSSSRGMCVSVADEAEEEVFTPMVIAMITGLSATLAFLIVYVLKKRADVAKRLLMRLMKDTVFVSFALLGDLADLITDVLAFNAVYADSDLKEYHLWYLIMLCISLAISSMAILVSIRVLYRMFRGSYGDGAKQTPPPAKPTAKRNKVAAIGPSLSAGKSPPDPATTINNSQPNRAANLRLSKGSILKLEAESVLRTTFGGTLNSENPHHEVELESEIKQTRHSIQRNYMKLLVVLLEDVPMLILNTLVEIKTADSGSKLEVRLSMMLSCLLMGVKLTSVPAIRRLRIQLQTLTDYAYARANPGNQAAQARVHSNSMLFGDISSIGRALKSVNPVGGGGDASDENVSSSGLAAAYADPNGGSENPGTNGHGQPSPSPMGFPPIREAPGLAKRISPPDDGVKT
eukprot:Rmarinus@m.5610